MVVHIDATQFSTVVYCDACVHWVVSANHRGEALVLAAKHESSVHPDTNQARDRLKKANSRDRHADSKFDDGNVTDDE